MRNPIGFHAVHRIPSPTERLEKLLRERNAEIQAISGFVEPEEEEDEEDEEEEFEEEYRARVKIVGLCRT